MGFAQRPSTRLGVALERLERPSVPTAEQRTPARKAPRNSNKESEAPLAPGTVRGRDAKRSPIIITTLGNGYLGSRIDEERSELRYLV